MAPAASEPLRDDPLLPEGLRGDGEGQKRFSVARSIGLQGVLLAGGLAALFFLLVALGKATNPFVVALAGAALLWPLRRQPVARAVLIAGGIVLGVWLLRTLGGVLAPFIAVWLLAFLLNPLVVAAERRWKVPRWATTLAITLTFLGVLALLVFLLVPMLVGQVQTLAQRVVELATTLPDLVARAEILDDAEAAGLVDREQLVRELGTFLPQQIQALAGSLPRAILSVTRSVGALIGLITTIVLVPVLLFYTLKDFPTLRRSLADLFPRYRGNRTYLRNVGEVVGNYLRGQLTISAIAAVVVTVPLLLFRVPFALVIGLMCGLLNMIPNLGALLSYVLGTVLMLAFGTPGDVVIVLAVLAGEALLEQTVLTPNIMSQQVGLHPVLVMLSLFVFGAFLGLLGLFIAVPVTALLVTMYRSFRESFVMDLDAGTRLVVPPDAVGREGA